TKKMECGMKKEIVVSRTHEETRVAIIENGKIVDLFIERRESEKIVGNIYKGRVRNVLPGLSSAFVDAGLEKNVYLYVDDVIASNKETKIEKMISNSEDILVQVDKEPISTKGAKATMDISLPGRFLVYMPFSGHIGISKNIQAREERSRLKSIVNSVRSDLPGAFIVRTEAEDATEKELKREVKYLTRLWLSIQHRAERVKAPALLHRDLGIVFQTVRDYFNEDVELFLVDSVEEHKEVLEFVKIVSPELADRVKLFTAKTPILKAFHVDEEIKGLRSNRVDLPSGGYLIIQEAESLCAIDVNTGRFTGKRSQEETVTITNIEAAKEIPRQLRLRNIGGIIVIDFIDMKHAKNRQRVLEAISQAVKGDKAKIKIWPITKLGLIEMTRERRRESFLALMGELCPQCHGSGQVLARETMFIAVKQELEQMKLSCHPGRVKIRLAPHVALYFRERIARLKKAVGGDIDIQTAHDVPWEDYQIIVE
ncbi:MAG: Rne/Rng family ribonuclease, partial [Elusimicrobiota bacterium]